MKTQLRLSPATRTSVLTLGALISVVRRERGWTQPELAERVGISTGTLAKVEKGAPGTAIGTVFEVATILGIPLFGDLDPQLLDQRFALVPARVRRRRVELDTDF
jgi:transcriptional regulator with XRE-family HTH domain